MANILPALRSSGKRLQLACLQRKLSLAQLVGEWRMLDGHVKFTSNYRSKPTPATCFLKLQNIHLDPDFIFLAQTVTSAPCTE
jgi:hypothetical protein